MKLYFVKRGGFLAPATPQDEQELEKIKQGSVVEMECVKKRNPKYHRKFMALLNIGFDAFEPPISEYKGHAVQKNFERFRKDLIIAAGFYDVVVSARGKPVLEAKSMSFAAMDENEFQNLFNAVANVLLRDVLSTYTRDDIDRVIDEIVHF